MADFDRAIDLDPSFAEAYANRGIGHIHFGDYDRACKDFQKACDLGDCAYMSWARKTSDCPFYDL
jgi:hypothetical protein